MLGGAYGTGLDIWTTLNIPQWIIVGMIVYPLWLIILWDTKGFDAVISHVMFIKDILTFFASIFLRVVEAFINVISRIIEAVPIAE
jgi:hypothetical protein